MTNIETSNQSAISSIRDAWIRAGRIKWAFIVILVLVAAHFIPLAFTNSAQDSCSFGPVSNARYRGLLAEAKQRQATQWPPVVWRSEMSEELNRRFAELAPKPASVFEKIAVMHAVLRALGAEYNRTGPEVDDPYINATSRGGNVVFQYLLDLNRLGYFAPVWRDMSIYGFFVAAQPKAKTSLNPHGKLGSFNFIARFPNWLDGPVKDWKSKFGGYCPRVPSPEWAKEFEASEYLRR